MEQRSERMPANEWQRNEKKTFLNWCELILNLERIFCEPFGLMELAMEHLKRSISAFIASTESKRTFGPIKKLEARSIFSRWTAIRNAYYSIESIFTTEWEI